MIHLENTALRLDMMPEYGASVRSMEFLGASGWKPVLVAAPDQSTDALSSGLFWMLPFANRARNNCLHEIRLYPNTAEPLALHGVAFQRPWSVIAQDDVSVSLMMRSADGDAPYQFAAGLELRLEGSSCTAELWMRNEARHEIPAGLGAHPYFPRLPDTQVQFSATHFFLEGPDHLPTDAISLPPELDFAVMADLPKSWRNNAYGGWNGRAVISQPTLGYRISMIADEGLRELMLYTDPTLPRFALEPQSHTSGATQQLVSAPQVGLSVLHPGQTLSGRFSLNLSNLC